MGSVLDGKPLTILLIVINVGVSIPGFFALRDKRRREWFLFIPSRVAEGRNIVGALLSHVSHGDIWHLLVNMVALYFFGPPVEKALGAAPYLIIYVVSGALASFAIFLLRRKNPRHAALGASGSIAGVLFASVVVAPSTSVYIAFIPIPVPAPIFAILYLVISSFMVGGEGRVSHEAHIGGAVTGFVLAGLLYAEGFDPFVQALTKLLS